MKDQILEVFKKHKDEPLTFEEITSELKADHEEVQNVLNEMVNNYDLFETKKKNRYMTPFRAGYFKGIILIKNLKFGFIQSNEFTGDFHVDFERFNGAFDKDEVLFRVSNNYIDEAEVVKIIKRQTKYVVGEIEVGKGLYFLEHNNKNIPDSIRITDLKNAKEKDIVRCIITNYDYDYCQAKVIEVIGNTSDIGIDISMIASNFNFPLKFKQEVIDYTNSISSEISKEVLNKRHRFENEIIFTIDGDDAKDLDDAVSIKLLENGNYELGVYIADVSYYVTEDSILDKEAYNRGTSVYLTDRVIPMLPVRLSNDLCSLNPNEDKLVMCCIMEINSFGKVVNSNICEGIISTKKRLTYSKCNNVLEYGLSEHPDYDIVYDSLKLMKKLADILSNMQEKRGALDFDIPEGKVIVDELGKPLDIVLRERGTSEKIIEQFMIIANETVASTIESLDLPFIYRVHDGPEQLKLSDLKLTAKILGYNFKGRHVSEIQKFLNSVKPEHNFLKTLVLRMMAKAIYSTDNIGHFGLASECYTHFTSPIRRYPDLIVHRLLRKYLINGEFENTDLLRLKQKLDDIAVQTSQKERDADNCEYDVLDMKKAEYMADHIGEEFTGIISNVTRFGMFVSLPNTVEGLVHISDMIGERYYYDEMYHDLTGETTHRRYKPGEKIDVVLIKSDKKTSEINFKIVYNVNRTSRSIKVGSKNGKEKNNRKKQKSKS